VSDPQDYAITVENLVKSYDGVKNAVDGLSFQVKSGEIYGLLGRNGAGKSTTIKVLTTLMHPSSGSASICGLDLRRKANHIRRMIGVVQQEESFDFTTVERNFSIYGMLWEVPRSIAEKRTEELMELFNLKELRKKRSFELSGGQKKRLQVAREFVHDMKVLFLDEPTSGMDPIMRREVLDFFREKAKEGLSILFTTQILEEADRLCDRIGIMDAGRLVAEGTASELKNRFGSMKKLVLTVSDEIADGAASNVREIVSRANGIEHLTIDGRNIIVLGNNVSRSLPSILSGLSSIQLEIDQINLESPSLDDVFYEVVAK
jgi:ABC-2 type transport system ATP-binding protein